MNGYPAYFKFHLYLCDNFKEYLKVSIMWFHFGGQVYHLLSPLISLSTNLLHIVINYTLSFMLTFSSKNLNVYCECYCPKSTHDSKSAFSLFKAAKKLFHGYIQTNRQCRILLHKYFCLAGSTSKFLFNLMYGIRLSSICN